MKTAPLRFLADMNLSPLTVAALRADGLDVVRVSSVLAVDASDVDILNLAARQRQVVITQDMDFSALLALSGHAGPSLVTLRLLDTDPDTVTRRLRLVLPQVEAALRDGSVVTITDSSVRVRELPIR